MTYELTKHEIVAKCWHFLFRTWVGVVSNTGHTFDQRCMTHPTFHLEYHTT